MPSDSDALRKKLRRFGISDHAITAAWPDWWSGDANQSLSARNDLHFSVARKLGLDPRSLLGDEQPRFIWRDEAKFKHFSGQTDRESAALTSFGVSIGRALVQATQAGRTEFSLDAQSIRKSIIAKTSFVSLRDLLSFCWTIGIPIIQLKVFPLSSKLMCAMAVNIGGRYAILIGRESSFPAQIAYYVAHELGHILLGHIRENIAVVEFDDILKSITIESDAEELQADQFALELLTGNPKPQIFTESKKFIARDLAQAALDASEELHIEPGTIALCLGHSTKKWNKAYASMKHIYNLKEPLWQTVNKAALTQLDLSLLPDELESFLSTVMGVSHK